MSCPSNATNDHIIYVRYFKSCAGHFGQSINVLVDNNGIGEYMFVWGRAKYNILRI